MQYLSLVIHISFVLYKGRGEDAKIRTQLKQDHIPHPAVPEGTLPTVDPCDLVTGRPGETYSSNTETPSRVSKASTDSLSHSSASLSPSPSPSQSAHPSSSHKALACAQILTCVLRFQDCAGLQPGGITCSFFRVSRGQAMTSLECWQTLRPCDAHESHSSSIHLPILINLTTSIRAS